MDLQFDATADGRPVKIVSVVDEHTLECPRGRVDRSPGMLIEELDRLSGQRRYRAVLRCDNATEPACAAMNEGAGERVGLAFIPPDNPGATATSSRSTAGPATNASPLTSCGLLRGMRAEDARRGRRAHRRAARTALGDVARL